MDIKRTLSGRNSLCAVSAYQNKSRSFCCGTLKVALYPSCPWKILKVLLLVTFGWPCSKDDRARAIASNCPCVCTVLSKGCKPFGTRNGRLLLCKGPLLWWYLHNNNHSIHYAVLLRSKLYVNKNPNKYYNINRSKGYKTRNNLPSFFFPSLFFFQPQEWVASRYINNAII